MKKLAQFFYFFACGLMLFSVTALAYIDPSAMTYMIQLIAGVAIAAGAGAGFYLRKLKRKFSKGRSSRANLQSYAADDDDDDTGYGDYELGPTDQVQPQFTASSALAAGAVCAPEPEPVAIPFDPFDETGGQGGLAAENRELRRLLAEARGRIAALERPSH